MCFVCAIKDALASAEFDCCGELSISSVCVLFTPHKSLLSFIVIKLTLLMHFRSYFCIQCQQFACVTVVFCGNDGGTDATSVTRRCTVAQELRRYLPVKYVASM